MPPMSLHIIEEDCPVQYSSAVFRVSNRLVPDELNAGMLS